MSFVVNLAVFSPAQGEQVALYGMFVADAFTGFLNAVILVATLISILLSWDFLNRADIHRGEYYILMLLASAGAMFMVGANDLVVVFVALELLSIPLYIMAAFHSIKRDGSPQALKSEESGMKYFILGAFSSAFLVYGAALIYGATGTTNIPEIFTAAQAVVGSTSSATFYLLVGTALLFVGLGFKVAVVPFHMWTPDVYEGAPTPVTAFMSVTAKIGGFAAMLRVMVTGLSVFALTDGDPAAWQAALSIVAILTLVLGNFVAISQTNLKRLLAYSSIAHAGYILIAVTASGTAGLGNVATMAIFMLSLTGVPLTAGFVGKFMIFSSAMQAGLYRLAIIGVLTSVASAFYYMRIVVNMYLRDNEDDVPVEHETSYVRWAIQISLAGTLIFGIFFPLATNLVGMVNIV